MIARDLHGSILSPLVVNFSLYINNLLLWFALNLTLLSEFFVLILLVSTFRLHVIIFWPSRVLFNNSLVHLAKNSSSHDFSSPSTSSFVQSCHGCFSHQPTTLFSPSRLHPFQVPFQYASWLLSSLVFSLCLLDSSSAPHQIALSVS
jgi:hypothetical protein